MPLPIRNGDIVTADAKVRGDIYVEHETITRIGRGLDASPGTEVIDATGKLVFPGFIDPHVHIYLPFMATFARDTHDTASVAALVGARRRSSRCAATRERCARGLPPVEGEGGEAERGTTGFHMSVSKFTG
jgi:dihydropyrimidinase